MKAKTIATDSLSKATQDWLEANGAFGGWVQINYDANYGEFKVGALIGAGGKEIPVGGIVANDLIQAAQAAAKATPGAAGLQDLLSPKEIVNGAAFDLPAPTSKALPPEPQPKDFPTRDAYLRAFGAWVTQVRQPFEDYSPKA